MPRKQKPARVERGLYRSGKTYYACATPPGSRQAVWKTLGEIGLMEARTRRDEFVVKVRREEAPALATNLALAEVALDWLAVQRHRVEICDLRPRTLDIYEQGLRLHVLPELGTRRVRTIRPDDLVAWHRRRQSEGCAPDSIHAWWTPLRLVLAHAVRLGHVDSNPADKLMAHERPKAGQSRKRFLTRSEMQRLLAVTPSHYRPAVATGLFAGLRLGEALGLVWADVDTAGQVLRVRFQLDRTGRRQELKTSAGRRDVILLPSLAAELRRHRLASPYSHGNDLAFASSTGRTIGHRNVSRRGLAKGCERAGLTGVTFHALRHTFASVLIAQGEDPVFVSRQLGHANPAITLRVYSHLFDAARHADRARDALEHEYGAMLGYGVSH